MSQNMLLMAGNRLNDSISMIEVGVIVCAFGMEQVHVQSKGNR